MPSGGAAGGQVQLDELSLAEVVAAANHGPDGPRARVDDGHRTVGIVPVGQDPVDGVLGILLQTEVDRAVDAQTSFEQRVVSLLLRGAELRIRQEPLLDVVDEVRCGISAFPLQVQFDLCRRCRLVRGRVDHPERDHSPEDEVAAGHGSVGVEHRVVLRRGGDQAGQQRGLRQRQATRSN